MKDIHAPNSRLLYLYMAVTIAPLYIIDWRLGFTNIIGLFLLLKEIADNLKQGFR
jgi:hypothetical protein